MSLLPVIARELRAEARRPFNYWLRVIGVAAITLVFAGSMIDQRESPAMLGTRLFGNLNATFFFAIWILVPLLTADCISREKREGTLGLLFLTRLTAHGIVMGKSLIHGLRALTLFLGMLPILALPFLIGGVSWKDGCLALMLDLSALILALTAGLLASTLAKDWVRASVLALVLSFTFAGAFLVIHLLGFLVGFAAALPQMPSRYPQGFSGYLLKWFWQENLSSKLAHLIGLATSFDEKVWDLWGFGGGWGNIWANLPPLFHYTWLRWAGGLLLLSFLFLMIAVHLAASQVRRVWRDAPQSARQLWFLATFCTPRVWRSIFRGKMKRKLERNPIGWLQQYSWGDRLTKWAWCLLIVIAECFLVTDPQLTLIWSGQYVLAQLLLLGLAFTASGSFRSERQSGAFELLLVTPLKEGQLINGRLRGIWDQFFPAALVLGLSWFYLSKDAKIYAGYQYINQNVWALLAFPLLFISSYCTLPVIGLHFSLRHLNFVAAWLLTAAVGLVLPLIGYGLFLMAYALTTPATLGPSIAILLGTQLTLAFIAGFFLKRSLCRRSFTLRDH
jgi:ABC-type transport system involved in multi-copper enzyme maturation permease subunit